MSGGERQGPVAGQLRERYQSSRRRASSRPAPRPGSEVVVLARRQLEAAVGHMLSGRRRQAQPRRGRREAPRAKTPRAATSRRRHSLARAACLLRVRTSSSASSGKAAAPEPSGGSSASAACPAAAQRCRSRRLTEPLRQLAPRYRRPPPTLGHCRGRAERRARRCGAGSGFYSASGTISPIYGRS